jgi:hypothetical protein
VTERRDDTTNGGAESRPARGRGRYYYDDATGYEPYDPESEEDEEDGEKAEGGGRKDESDADGRTKD